MVSQGFRFRIWGLTVYLDQIHHDAIVSGSSSGAFLQKVVKRLKRFRLLAWFMLTVRGSGFWVSAPFMISTK